MCGIIFTGFRDWDVDIFGWVGGVDIILPTTEVRKAHLAEEVIFKVKTQHKSDMRSIEESAFSVGKQQGQRA